MCLCHVMHSLLTVKSYFYPFAWLAIIIFCARWCFSISSSCRQRIVYRDTASAFFLINITMTFFSCWYGFARYLSLKRCTIYFVIQGVIIVNAYFEMNTSNLGDTICLGQSHSMFGSFFDKLSSQNCSMIFQAAVTKMSLPH